MTVEREPVGSVLREPAIEGGRIRKGVILARYASQPAWGGLLLKRIPALRKYFWLVENLSSYGRHWAPDADVLMANDVPAQREIPLRPGQRLFEYGTADFVDTDVFRPDGREKSFDAIMVACWVPLKRHDLFLDAVQALTDAGRLFRAVLFGHFDGGATAQAEQLAYRERIVSRIRTEGLPIELPGPDRDNREFLGKAAVAGLINASRVGLLLSQKEGVPKFKLECMACDVPVIVCVDGNWPVRKHVNERTGLIVPPLAGAIAEAMIRLAKGPRLSPRRYVLESTGKRIAMERLQATIDELDREAGFLVPAPLDAYDGREGIRWTGFVDWVRERYVSGVRAWLRRRKRTAGLIRWLRARLGALLPRAANRGR